MISALLALAATGLGLGLSPLAEPGHEHNWVLPFEGDDFKLPNRGLEMEPIPSSLSEEYQVTFDFVCEEAAEK